MLATKETGRKLRSINKSFVCTEVNNNEMLIRIILHITDMHRLRTGIRSEKCVVRRFRRCANVYLHKPR